MDEQTEKNLNERAFIAWGRIKDFLDRADNPEGVQCLRLIQLGGIEVAVADKRFSEAFCLLTKRQQAVLVYTWNKFLDFMMKWKGDPMCIYGAAIEFAEHNRNFDIYFNGELL